MLHVYYTSSGLVVDEWNIDNCKKELKQTYEESLNRDISICFRTELGMQLLSLAVVKGEIAPSKVAVHFEGHSMTIDDDGLFSEWPENFLHASQKISREILEATLNNNNW